MCVVCNLHVVAWQPISICTLGERVAVDCLPHSFHRFSPMERVDFGFAIFA